MRIDGHAFPKYQSRLSSCFQRPVSFIDLLNFPPLRCFQWSRLSVRHAAPPPKTVSWLPFCHFEFAVITLLFRYFVVMPVLLFMVRLPIFLADMPNSNAHFVVATLLALAKCSKWGAQKSKNLPENQQISL